VGAIRRNPTPPGPITDLFDRLHEIHLVAGLPSVREIALGIGRGVISSSTIHNMFRGPRVPRWSFLELVVEELHGDIAEFRRLWQAARIAENRFNAPSVNPPDVTLLTEVTAESAVTEVEWGIYSIDIPVRNPSFTGRLAELETLRANLVAHRGDHPLAQVIYGPGGIGKSEIAAEYSHLHRNHYDIIWWIGAEHHDRVKGALIKLAQRLQLRQVIMDSGRDRTIATVLEALESGALGRWLLVIDDAVEPLDTRRYLPAVCPRGSHVIITSRVQNWPDYIEANSIEVTQFTEAEAVDFLRRRIPALAASERLHKDEEAQRFAAAARLAAALGHLPIAAEHAAAYLAETGESVDEYLTRFGENARRLFTEQPSDLPAQVSATWEISTALLTADAEHLFNLCAFFSAEPIEVELLIQNARVITGPPGLGEVLGSSPRFRAAATQLQRLSLAKVDGARDLIQLHRVVQAATRTRLRQYQPEMFAAYRAATETLLAASNPGHPDLGAHDVAYELSLPHLESDQSYFSTDNPALRRLVIDQVRRLHLRGRHGEAAGFGQEALRVWSDQLGRADLQVLTMAVEVAIARRLDGDVVGARELTLETLIQLRQHYGDEHEVALLCANLYGADLRTRGQFAEALELDLSLLPRFERVFGPDHERTFNVRNNLAADYRRLGQFAEALEHDLRNVDDRGRILGPSDMRTLSSSDAAAFDLRGLGRYQESLDVTRKVVAAFATLGGRDSPDSLNARKGFAVALRKAGHHADALRESEEVVRRYREYLGPDHSYTLRAAANLINDRRAIGDLAGAEEIGREVQQRCQAVGFPPEFSYPALVSLASVLRLGGRAEEARRYDLQARAGLVRVYGDRHPFTLAADINYATDLAARGALAEAVGLGRETYASCRDTLGADHPDTLMAAANLGMDEEAAGNRAEAERLLADTLSRYERTLTAEHPEARAAAQGIRLTAEIEAY
jgi:tetratricopeptide (TPR) repeat protein